MQSLSLWLCFLAIFHCTLSDAFPNEGAAEGKSGSENQNRGQSKISAAEGKSGKVNQYWSTTTPRVPYKISANVIAYKKFHNTTDWEVPRRVMIRISNRNEFHLEATENNDGKLLANDTVDIKDVHSLQSPGPSTTSLRMTYGNAEYDLSFASYEEAKKFYEALSNVKEENTTQITTPSPVTTDYSGQSELNNRTGGSSSLTEQEAGSAVSQSTSGNTQQQGTPDQIQQGNPEVNSTQPLHICTVSTQYYDCQIQRVHIRDGDFYRFRHEPTKQVITFRDSVLHYLPKSLIDAFPNMRLLNLNQLKIATIENNAFDNATHLEKLFLEGNRLKTFPIRVLHGARNLKELILTKNEITNMPYIFKSNSNLNDLLINENKINQLPTFDHIPLLKTFNGSNNVIAQISPNQFVKQTQIEYIDLSHNQLQYLDLPFSSQNLRAVDISNNKLTNLRITLQMEHLNIENNDLSTFDINEGCSLKLLKISNNKLEIAPNFANCHLMHTLDASNNSLETFRYSVTFENLEKLNLAHNQLFEFKIPPNPKNPFKLSLLDLSHNQLSYLSSLSSFAALKDLRLNNNKLLTIQANSLPKGVKTFFMSNNQWQCAEVSKFVNIVKDSDTYCNSEFKLTHGICCKDYRKPYNDLLNEMVRNAHFHEQSNYDRLKNMCQQNQYTAGHDDIEKIRQLASNTDRNRAQIYEQIARTRELITEKQAEQNAIKSNHDQSKNFMRNMALLIESKRDAYHVTKEGLITDKEMLNKVINFVRQRNTFNAELLKRRQNETQNTYMLFDQKTNEKEQMKTEIEKLKINKSKMKELEKQLKKEMELLHKAVNNNAPAIYGKTGKS